MHRDQYLTTGSRSPRSSHFFSGHLSLSALVLPGMQAMAPGSLASADSK